MGYRQLIIVRKDLDMSKGKMAVQVSHAVMAYFSHAIRNAWDDNNIRKFISEDVFNEYINGKFVKTVCQAKNKNQLLKARVLAEDLGLVEGIDFGFIYDACLTELEPEEENGTCLTCFWTAPLEDEVAHKISRKYHLFVG